MSGSEPHEFIPVNVPFIGEREKELVAQALETGWISSEGPFVAEFEEKLSARVDRRHGIAVTNGTAALEIAVRALDIGPGDEVILPTFTIISCAQAVTNAGAIPVTVDCDPRTWNMTPEGVAAAVTPRTKAVMAVHIYGLPVDMDPILETARRHNLAVIEDAAEAIGQSYKDRPCGSIGDISTFSFYANKNITTGEGGMIMTNDNALAERCRSLRNLCFQPGKRFVHEEIGWNCRFTNLQAALGIAQLERLNETIRKKRRMAARYNELLQDVSWLDKPAPRTEHAENDYWVYGVTLNSQYSGPERDKVCALLQKSGVGVRPFFWPIHEQPVYRDRYFQNTPRHPNAERIARTGFYLPSGVALTDQQIVDVVERFRALDLANQS